MAESFNRGTAFAGSFALTSNAKANRRQAATNSRRQQLAEREQFKTETDKVITDSLKLLATSAKMQSVNAFSPDGNREEAVEIQTKTAQTLWASTKQRMEKSGLYAPADIENTAQQFRIAATLNNPVAERKLEKGVDVAANVTQAQQETDTSAEFVNFIKPGGEGKQPIRKSARKGSSEASALSKQGFIRDKRSEIVTGTPDDFTPTGAREEKAILELAETRIVTENFDTGLSQLQDFIRSDNYVGGITGASLQLINSAAQQFAQLTGTEKLFNGTELNIENIDDRLSDENIGFLRRAGISGDVREAAKARLAYILAKQLDPNGRISNADVDNAEKILSGSADRQSTLLTIQNLRDTSRKEFNTRARIMEETLKGTADPFRQIGKSSGLGDQKSVGDLSDEELLQQLNK